MPLQLHFPSISTYKTQPSILAARDAVLPSLSHGNEHPISKAKVDCVQSRVYDESSQTSSESDDQTDSEEESASETEDREVLYRELFGVSQPPEDSGDEASDEHERYAFPDSLTSFTEKESQIISFISSCPIFWTS
jgi:hypothetical protein